jgi:hypothetical protein
MMMMMMNGDDDDDDHGGGDGDENLFFATTDAIGVSSTLTCAAVWTLTSQLRSQKAH